MARAPLVYFMFPRLPRVAMHTTLSMGWLWMCSTWCSEAGAPEPDEDPEEVLYGLRIHDAHGNKVSRICVRVRVRACARAHARVCVP